jgi:DNA-binding NtrC family response regulator
MSGMEALGRIREIDRRVGIIMLTAVEDESVAREAMQREAYDYITKPLDVGYLELAILTKLAQAAG